MVTKVAGMRFYEYPLSVSGIVTYRKTDIHGEANITSSARLVVIMPKI
jgi:hypothetical protein